MQKAHHATVLELARSQASAESDPEVARAVALVIHHRGHAALALRDLADADSRFGAADDFLTALVEQTFEALLGKDELVEKLEAQRRSLVGSAVVTGGVAAAAQLLSAAAGLQTAAAAVVFLYLVPIGVRAAHETWRKRREQETAGAPELPAGAPSPD